MYCFIWNKETVELKRRIERLLEHIPREYNKFLKGATCIALILVALLFFGNNGESKGKYDLKITEATAEENKEASSEIEENVGESSLDTIEIKTIIVDISGEVIIPGVYEIPSDYRLNDLIEMAGGLSEDADIDRINRARTLIDGEKIYIPSFDEALEIQSPIEVNEGKVNINSAGIDELQTISGIGPVTAEKIISYREEHGAFTSIEELLNISGIGEKTFKKMQDYVTV